MFFELFKTNKHRKFNFEPRYYNEEKEKLKHRVEKIKKELNSDSDIDYQYSSSISFKKLKNKPEKYSYTRLFIIVYLCTQIFLYLYFGNVAFNLLWIFLFYYLFVRFDILQYIKRKYH